MKRRHAAVFCFVLAVAHVVALGATAAMAAALPAGYQLPWRKGEVHQVGGNGYGQGGHVGIDLYALDFNLKEQPVLAVNAGTVITVVNNQTACGASGSYGNRVEIDHGSGYRSFYSHLKSVRVRQGQKVVTGQELGISGHTGNVSPCNSDPLSGAHLHFRMTLNGVAQKPEPMGGYTGFRSGVNYTSNNEFNLNWYVRLTNTTGSNDYWFTAGKTGTPVAGNWDGLTNQDYTDNVGVVKGNTWSLFTPSGTSTFNYGVPSDIPLTGDWNGDHKDTPAVLRGNTWILNNTLDGTGDYSCGYGTATDHPLVGDWNGDGKDEIGVYRASNETFYLATLTYSGTSCTPVSYRQVTIGNMVAKDTPLAGNFDVLDAADEIGYVHDKTWILYTGQAGSVKSTFTYGLVTDVPLVGDWDSNALDTPVVARRG